MNLQLIEKIVSVLLTVLRLLIDKEQKENERENEQRKKDLDNIDRV